MPKERARLQLQHDSIAALSRQSSTRSAAFDSTAGADFADVCTAKHGELHAATVRHLRRCLEHQTASSGELDEPPASCARCHIRAADVAQKLFFQGRVVNCYPESSELHLVLSEDADHAMSRLHGLLGAPLGAPSLSAPSALEHHLAADAAPNSPTSAALSVVGACECEVYIRGTSSTLAFIFSNLTSTVALQAV